MKLREKETEIERKKRVRWREIENDRKRKTDYARVGECHPMNNNKLSLLMNINKV